MVVHRITRKEVVIADPGKGIVHYNPEEFFNIWTGVLILMVPANDFEKGNKKK